MVGCYAVKMNESHSAERKRVEDTVSRLLEKAEAVVHGHFVGNSGRHLDTYVNKDKIFADPQLTQIIAGYLAQLYAGDRIEAVIGPAVGGALLAQQVALQLRVRTGLRVASVFTDKAVASDGKPIQTLKRGYDTEIGGRRLLMVEDVLTTGGSLKQVIDAVRQAFSKDATSAPQIIGAVAIVNRDPQRVTSKQLGVPLDALVRLDLKSYEESEVPESLRKVPISTELGHGKQYLATLATGQKHPA